MSVLTGLRDNWYDLIMRWWCSKPQSGNSQSLGLCRFLLLTTLLFPPHQSHSFSGSSCSSSSYLPPSGAFNVASPLSLARSPRPLLAWIIVHLDFVPTCHQPASAACLCAPRRMPASASVSRVYLPPLAALRLCPCPCWSLGGPLPLVPPYLLCPHLSPSPCESSYPVIFWCLVSFSSGGLFRV